MALKVGVVDEIAVGLSVLRDIHLKIGHEFPAGPAHRLVNRVNPVWEIDALAVAVFVANKVIALGFLGIFIAARRFQIDFKLCAFLRRFDLCFTIVGMLDDGDIALDDFFRCVDGGIVQFNLIQLRLCAHRIDGGV